MKSCTVLLSEIISTKDFHLSVKLRISKAAILKNAIYSKEKSSVFCKKRFCHLGRTKQLKFGQTALPNQTCGRSLLLIHRQMYLLAIYVNFLRVGYKVSHHVWHEKFTLTVRSCLIISGKLWNESSMIKQFFVWTLGTPNIELSKFRPWGPQNLHRWVFHDYFWGII